VVYKIRIMIIIIVIRIFVESTPQVVGVVGSEVQKALILEVEVNVFTINEIIVSARLLRNVSPSV